MLYNLKLSGLSCLTFLGFPWVAEGGSWDEEAAPRWHRLAKSSAGGLPGGFAAQLCWHLSAGSHQKPWALFQAEEGL